MKTPHTTRTVLLSAALLFVVSLSGSGHAKVLSPEDSDLIRHNETTQFGTVDRTLTLEQLIEPFNFRAVDSAAYAAAYDAMDGQLATRGLSKRGRSFLDGQQISTWYSAGEDRSVLCVGWADAGGYSQAVYTMPGKIRRADTLPLP